MKTQVILISDQKSVIEAITRELSSDFSTLLATSITEGLDIFKAHQTDVILMDAALSAHPDNMTHKALFSQFWGINPMVRFVILTIRTRDPFAIKAVEAGASKYLHYPSELFRIRPVIESVIQHLEDSHPTRHFISQDVQSGFSDMLKTRSETMRRVFEKVSLVSQTPTTVLLTGETGVGKGVVARLIHEKSNRASGPLLSVHCGAIPEPLIESELFGHEKGAFTGAIKSKRGKFNQASKGSIFLDEIGTVTSATQIKLLQVLQDKTYQPVGSDKTLSTDVRIIAASNSDLEQMVNRDEFRKDLYFRLNIFPIEIPALRHRREDLPLFLQFFIDHFNAKHEKRIKGVTPEVLQAFNTYQWPGNIRELENLLQRAFILETGDLLSAASFPADLFSADSPPPPEGHIRLGTLADARQKAIDKAEYDYLCSALKTHSGKINQTAETAGISRRQLHKLLSKHHIRKEDFKRRHTSRRHQQAAGILTALTD